MVRFSMRRQKSQRPKVHAAGTRDPVWRVQYREYFVDSAGQEQFHHRSHSWSQDTHTKKQAQAAADKLILKSQQGPVKADGGMSLDGFWRTIYLPIRSRKWTGATFPTVTNMYRNHILPVFGSVALQDITKAAIQIHLGRLVDAGHGKATVEAVRIRLHSILAEALDNDFVLKNVCRRVETPTCKPTAEPRSLTEAEVQMLWDGTSGRDYIFWRILILTGARIGEVLALERADLRPDGLMIDEAVVCGKVKLPKRNKTRLAALPESLRAELEEWLTSHDNRLTHLLQFATQSGGNLLIPHKAMPPAAKS